MQQTEVLRDMQAIHCKLSELMNIQAKNLGIYMARHWDLFVSILSLQLQEQLHNVKTIQNEHDSRLGGPL